MNKPIMEKKRRARINDCLNELKSLVLEGLKKDPARHSKLEKADILEMAVKHMRSLQSRSAAPGARFQEGYADCVKEVATYLSGHHQQDSELNQGLMVHLASAYRPLATPAGSQQSAAVLDGLQLVPTVLVGGEVGYILQRAPSGLLLTASGQEPPAASVGGSLGSSSSVGSVSPAPSWDPADPHSPPSPCPSERSFGSCEDSPQPLALVAHNRSPDDEAHWRPW